MPRQATAAVYFLLALFSLLIWGLCFRVGLECASLVRKRYQRNYLPLETPKTDRPASLLVLAISCGLLWPAGVLGPCLSSPQPGPNDTLVLLGVTGFSWLLVQLLNVEVHEHTELWSWLGLVSTALTTLPQLFLPGGEENLWFWLPSVLFLCFVLERATRFLFLRPPTKTRHVFWLCCSWLSIAHLLGGLSAKAGGAGWPELLLLSFSFVSLALALQPALEQPDLFQRTRTRDCHQAPGAVDPQ